MATKESQNNDDNIEKFLNNCVANGIGKLRVLKYRQQLKNLSQWLGKPFVKATKDDLEELIKIIHEKDYTEWTKHDYKVCVKKFYKWLNGGEEYPKTVGWIKTTMHNGKTKLPQDMLSEDEIKKMVEYAPTVRDKAFVITLYETGCRIGEMLSIKTSAVSFEKYGTVLNVTGKTGDRRVLVIMATPYLRDWFNNHPFKNKPKTPLWIMSDGEALTSAGATALLKRIAERAKIAHKVNPHNFRHTRATHLANHLTEAQMKEYLGWTQSSDMASVYVHLSGRDTDRATLKMHGLVKEEEKEESELRPQKCPRCNEINKATAKFCDKCGAILDIKTAIQLEKKQADEKDVLHLFIKKIVEKNPKEATKVLKEFPKEYLDKLQNL